MAVVKRDITAFAVAVMMAAVATRAEAVPLYGTSLQGFNRSTPGPSQLYLIDQTTGAGTAIGSIGHAINGLTFDSTTNTLYGSTPTWNTGFHGLVSIDPDTGAATTIGSGFGLPQVWGITVNSAGDMFGWTEGDDDLVRINKATGVATVVGPSSTGTLRDVLAFDISDSLRLVRGGTVWDINTSTGGGITLGTITDPGHNGDFDPDSGLLWSVLSEGRTQDSVIRISDLTTFSSVSNLDTDVEYLHTLAFADFSVIPEPGTLATFGFGLGALAWMRRRRTP